MNVFDYVHDPFLRGLTPVEKVALEEKLKAWGLYSESFAQRLDNWFSNFDTLDDKRLASRVLGALKYYTPEGFTSRLKQLYQAIERNIAGTLKASRVLRLIHSVIESPPTPEPIESTSLSRNQHHL